MLIFIDCIYSTPVRELTAIERPTWPFHMSVHYCDINNLTLPKNDVELVVFERQDRHNAEYIVNMGTEKFTMFLADLRNMGVKYAILDISLKPVLADSIGRQVMLAANTAIVPIKDRMAWGALQ